MTRPRGANDVKDTELRDQFPIVGVGASAGGLAPTVELIRELGPRPQVAIVVIHHLDPTRESGLVDILAHATPMTVVFASDGVAAEPNHVYVLAPNDGLLMQAGVLRVVPRVGTGGLHLPINQFFESLAVDQESLAVGVVLSGTGYDATNGIKAIKGHGGIALAQDSTAQHAGMPESAIATGCVDFVMAPPRLAQELARLGAHPPPIRASRAKDHDYLEVLAAVRKTSGVDFANYKQSTIRRRLERRLFLRGCTELGAYLELLKRDPTEASALSEDLLIHVTNFFREPDAFEALRVQVLPKLLQRLGDAPLRIWVPGCSTGEEVYSIAMCVLEFLGEAHRDDVSVKIFGTDLSATIIEKARAGRFPVSIEANVSPARLKRFFTQDERGYCIRHDIRDLCVFARHDVTCDPPFSTMDLISCRNMMIYLGQELQDRVIGLFHYALNERGFLALGSTETVGAFVGFSVVDGKNKIYARSSAAARRTFDFLPPRSRSSTVAGGVTSGSSTPTGSWKSSSASEVQREADRLVLAEFAPPGVVVTENLAVIQFRGHTGAFLEHIPGAATLDLLRLAREELRLPLRRAVDSARTTNAAVLARDVAILVGQQRRMVTLEVIPFAIPPQLQRFFLVLFRDATSSESTTDALPGSNAAEAVPTADDDDLRRDLASTRQYLESVVEQSELANEELKAANEEIVSSNEELRSTNEELQSAKEELQATNEELRTLNDELENRSVSATRLSNDLTNVLTSVEIPILIVNRDLTLRRFTPAAARLFSLVAADLGRPVDAVVNIRAVLPGLASALLDVLENLHPQDSLFEDAAARWQELSVRPYLTHDGRIDGTVISVRDVDVEKRSAERLTTAKKYAEGIVSTVREGLVVLDRELRVQSANKAFLQAFQVNAQEIQGKCLDDLGCAGLVTPALRKLLDELAEDGEPLRLEQSGDACERVFMVIARRIEQTELVLLAFADVTESERAAKELHAYQEDLQRMSFEAAIAEERERRRLAIELHDRLGQPLALAQIKLTSVRGELSGDARAAVDAAVALLEQAIAEERALIFDLSPPILYDLGLAEALAWLAEDFEARYGITLEVVDDGSEKPMNDSTRAIVFRTVRELVMNVRKHAGITAAKVSLQRHDDVLAIVVEDHGVGFEVDAQASGKQRHTFGLLSVQEQIARVGGTLNIVSKPGQGTRVSVQVPLQVKDHKARGGEEAP
jgi:two-component system, chemotaxis family, CheB/CheR fusion protein